MAKPMINQMEANSNIWDNALAQVIFDVNVIYEIMA